MKLLTKTFILAAIATQFAATDASATAFTFTYTFADSTYVSGSFNGTQSGNLITGLSNINLNFNGTPATTSPLYGSRWDNSIGNWASGGAVASVDGTQNNFLFIDVDYPISTGFTEYFLMVDGVSGGSWDPNQAYWYDATTISSSGEYTNVARWHLSGANSSVPDGGSTIAMLGLALTAVAGARRKFGI